MTEKEYIPELLAGAMTSWVRGGGGGTVVNYIFDAGNKTTGTKRNKYKCSTGSPMDE
jgi:hypothetical protein